MTTSVRLHWPGKSLGKRPAEAQLARRAAGDAGCTLVHGDNLAALHALERDGSTDFALAYLDPPFFTGRRLAGVRRTRDPVSGRVVRDPGPSFDDRWSGLDEYLTALGDRIAAVRDLLAPHGCLVLHVDPKTSHYAKVLCDEVFGPRCFASEIVWRYRRWPAKTANFQRVHDVLLRYVKDPDVRPRFCQLYEPLAASTLATWGDKKQRAVLASDGRRQRSSSTAEDTPGAPLGDVWEIGIVAPVARERTGYPTQKPEALLARLISACTEPGDRVLDAYSGSGTALVVATRLGRAALGIDENPEAIQIARDRLLAAGVRPGELSVEPGPAVASARRRRARPRVAA